jgi:hypothetical protein
MAEETESLVLEHLRAMRADSAAMRAGQDALRREMQDGFARVSQRIDRLETELRGLSYIVSTAVGALEERTEQPT